MSTGYMSSRSMLAAGLLVPALATGAAQAGDPLPALVVIESVPAAPGGTALVGVTIEVEDQIGSFAFDAFAEGLEISGVVYDGPLFAHGWEGWDSAPSSTPNISAACIFPDDQVTGFQQLFTMEIPVPADAEVGSFITVEFTSASVTNYSFDVFDVTVVTGGIVVDPEAHTCTADIAGGDGVVDTLDLVFMLGAWGDTGGDADINDDASVDVMDLLMLLAAWGTCS